MVKYCNISINLLAGYQVHKEVSDAYCYAK